MPHLFQRICERSRQKIDPPYEVGPSRSRRNRRHGGSPLSRPQRLTEITFGSDGSFGMHPTSQPNDSGLAAS
jgi:hypothetical protein